MRAAMTGNVSERRTQPPLIDVPVVVFCLHATGGYALSDHSVSGTLAERGDTCQQLHIRLVRRTRDPFRGCWALPGDSLVWHESLADTAMRVSRSALGLEPAFFQQLHTFGAVERSASDLRRISVVYWAMLDEDAVTHVTRMANVAWFPLRTLPALAFDHRHIVEHALARLAQAARDAPVGRYLLRRTFTLSQLRHVHEAIKGTKLDAANFRRRILATGSLRPVGVAREGAHRPARLYEYAPLQALTESPADSTESSRELSRSIA